MERMVRAVMAAALGALLVYAALTFLSAWERCSRLEERLLLLQQERESLREENESLEIPDEPYSSSLVRHNLIKIIKGEKL